MSHSVDPTAHKALAINVAGRLYGTFAEIGAGQEVARWFFSVGGAAGTVAKTISAYDMTVSDAIYGKAPRYVSRERVREMLDHEYALLHERLAATRGDRTRFFVLADTAAARSFSGGGECHAWMALRFQHAPGVAASDILLHVRLLDAGAARQQDALGRLGVNLLHASDALWSNPRSLLERLLDDIGAERMEIDWVTFSGPAFAAADNRLLCLHLVRLGFTPAVLFAADGGPLLASEALRRKAILVERGRFAPLTLLNLQMLAAAGEAFHADLRGSRPAGGGPAAGAASGPASTNEDPAEVAEVLELSMGNLRDRGHAADEEFLSRVDLISTVGKMVLVSDLVPFYALAEYLAARQVAAAGFVLGVPLLRELFNEAHYRDLVGGILEAFGRLFTKRVRLYVQATRDPVDGRVVTADTLRVAPHLVHLLEHLRVNRLVRPLPCDEATLRTYSSEDVRSRLCSGDPSWREFVAAPVAERIERLGAFGFTCDR